MGPGTVARDGDAPGLAQVVERAERDVGELVEPREQLGLGLRHQLGEDAVDLEEVAAPGAVAIERAAEPGAGDVERDGEVAVDVRVHPGEREPQGGQAVVAALEHDPPGARRGGRRAQGVEVELGEPDVEHGDEPRLLEPAGRELAHDLAGHLGVDPVEVANAIVVRERQVRHRVGDSVERGVIGERAGGPSAGDHDLDPYHRAPWAGQIGGGGAVEAARVNPAKELALGVVSRGRRR